MARMLKGTFAAVLLCGSVGVGMAAAQVSGTAGASVSGSNVGAPPIATGSAGAAIDAESNLPPTGRSPATNSTASGTLGAPIGASGLPPAEPPRTASGADAAVGVTPEAAGVTAGAETTAGGALGGPAGAIEAEPAAPVQADANAGVATGQGVLDTSSLNLGQTSTPAATLNRATKRTVDANERRITAELNRAAAMAAGRAVNPPG